MHEVKRSTVYDDVIALLSHESVLNEFPLRIKFSGEIGYDTGGVCRDMISAFWEEAYKKFFDGSCLLTPVLHPHVDMTVLPSVGTVLSHGYLVSGFLPTRVIFPALAYILLGTEVEVPSAILVETLADSLSAFEASVIKNALIKSSGKFSDGALSSLISILSRYGCRKCPATAEELKSQLLCVCRYEFQVKPLAAFNAIRGGVPHCERPFWESHSISDLHTLYLSLCATPQMVLAILDEPEEVNMCQARVFGYLQQYIGNMKKDELRRFLRFTTGSSVLIASRISVTFNNLDGLARRPIAHTCGCVIELPATYTSYLDFEEDFTAILSDNEYAWQMHAI